MTLLTRVVGRLTEREIPCALIGAEALALRGVSRATADRDLLTTSREALAPALWRGLGGAAVRVEIRRGAADLVLLKLYAGGPQDAWDIAQLLAGGDSETIVGDVSSRLGELPADCRRLWEKILSG